MLMLNGYESHINAEFNKYYKANNIKLLCLLIHSLHLTQPLCYSYRGSHETSTLCEKYSLCSEEDFCPKTTNTYTNI